MTRVDAALVVEYFWALDAKRALTGGEDSATLADVTSALERAEVALREAVGAAPPADARTNARVIAALRHAGREREPASGWQEQVWTGIDARRKSWWRRAWQRLTGGAS